MPGRAWVVVLLLAAGVSASAQPNRQTFSFLPLSGRVFSDVYVPTNNHYPDKPLEQATLSLWLESDPHFSEKTWAKLIYQGDAFDAQYSYLSGNTQVSHVESRLREAYVTSVKGGWEIRAGQQIIPWGKSDVFNPTDYHTAKNLSFLNPDDEVRRVGSTSMWISWTPDDGQSPWNNTAVFTAIPARGRLLFPPGVVPANISVSDPELDPVGMANAEFGYRLAYTGTGWDASVSYFNGLEHLPELEEISHEVPAPGTLLLHLRQVYHRNTAVGADASLVSGQWTFRAESAYIRTINDDGSNPLLLPTHWDSVAGVERPLGENFRVQAQVLVRYFPRYTSPDNVTGPDPVSLAVNREIAATNALLLQYQDPTRPGGTLRVGYLDEKTGVDGDIFVLQNFAGGDYLLRPRFTYAWTDLLKTTVGAELYGGPSNRPLGALNAYSAYFFEAKYTF